MPEPDSFDPKVTANPDLEHELAALAEKVERLVALCAQLRGENQALKQQIAQLTTERNEYLARTQSVRKHVQQTLERLQLLSQRT
ncbi:MAG: hypothetical protein N3A55_10045 [Methylohalobius sp.]|nr:hypothetical protein [Methylohalobius sp.]